MKEKRKALIFSVSIVLVLTLLSSCVQHEKVQVGDENELLDHNNVSELDRFYEQDQKDEKEAVNLRLELEQAILATEVMGIPVESTWLRWKDIPQDATVLRVDEKQDLAIISRVLDEGNGFKEDIGIFQQNLAGQVNRLQHAQPFLSSFYTLSSFYLNGHTVYWGQTRSHYLSESSGKTDVSPSRVVLQVGPTRYQTDIVNGAYIFVLEGEVDANQMTFYDQSSGVDKIIAQLNANELKQSRALTILDEPITQDYEEGTWYEDEDLLGLTFIFKTDSKQFALYDVDRGEEESALGYKTRALYEVNKEDARRYLDSVSVHPQTELPIVFTVFEHKDKSVFFGFIDQERFELEHGRQVRSVMLTIGKRHVKQDLVGDSFMIECAPSTKVDAISVFDEHKSEITSIYEKGVDIPDKPLASSIEAQKDQADWLNWSDEYELKFQSENKEQIIFKQDIDLWGSGQKTKLYNLALVDASGSIRILGTDPGPLSPFYTVQRIVHGGKTYVWGITKQQVMNESGDVIRVSPDVCAIVVDGEEILVDVLSDTFCFVLEGVHLPSSIRFYNQYGRLEGGSDTSGLPTGPDFSN